MSKVTSSKDCRLHHKSSKHSSASLKDERRWDKALKKLCDKAAGHLSLSSNPNPASPTSSHVSCPSFLEEVEPHELDLSEDEGLPPEQPAFTSLFLQALFKSLLFKAVNAAQVGPGSSEVVLPSSQGSLNPLFAEPASPVDSIPAPPLFLDVVRKQWSSPGSAPTPTSADGNNFNVAPDLAALLQVLTVDAPVAALLPNAAIPGDLDEGLHP